MLKDKLGLPFLLYRYRRRKLFFIGLLACLGVLFCATRFIWAFELDGNRQLTEDMLRGFLEKQNVSYGMAISDLDIDAFEKACEDENTTMYIICHPHNPTGRIWTPDELLKMAEICRKHHVLMVSDEVHGDLTRSGNTFEPMMKVVGPQGLITLTAVNKTFNLAGLAMTNIIIQDEELKKIADETGGIPFEKMPPVRRTRRKRDDA